MGQVITLLPLLERTIIVQDDNNFSNLVKTGSVGGAQNVSTSGGTRVSSSPRRTSPVLAGRVIGGQEVPPPSSNEPDLSQTPDYGVIPEGGGGFGIGGGFPEGGDFETPDTQEEYPVLGTDSYGCPYYGLDEAGRPLYGVDQEGNVITDPKVLPCGMKGQEAPVSDVSPVSQIASDKTLKTALLVVGGLVLFTLLVKK